ncbi:YifB family Mg chelatase-like AAA ATPase [Candidatus Saganbacteria bacterium]|uniref:YifB family Mg chelatase-like AAA ATPase n=1 Tax=Candidatus Saganbacteria bacterium TaxID=2575572 RepID=A0A9D6UKX5_UNCSA|nr:YifB family Mg chelatase-like AAA ATPase [Candidatus Saganbacteria bacterium]
MLVKIGSAVLHGLDAYMVAVEVDSVRGLPGLAIVGLPDAAVRESRDRVRFAIENSGFEFPPGYFTVNLAPADIRKEGPMYDLPIAIGILSSSQQVSQKHISGTIILGELSLDGGIRPVEGVLPVCIAAKREGMKRVMAAAGNADEAALVEGLEVIPVGSLGCAVEFLNGQKEIIPHKIDMTSLFGGEPDYGIDFAEVKGQGHVKRALEVAAAGGHNALLVGSPGSGKTMLARRIPTILPLLSVEEALEVTKLYSVTGLLSSKGSLITIRPFRSPHHTTSDVGIIGGGRIPRPGEVSLSHLGVLFLDEFPEFEREVLEVLRQPLEDGKVTISRAHSTITYPAEFMLVAAMNPCPCGNYMDSLRACTCPPYKVQRYWGKLSGPLLDRIDLHIEVPRLKKEELLRQPEGEPSGTIRARVSAARRIQQMRFKGSGVHCNARMTPRQVKEFCVLDKEAEELLKSAILHLQLSGRAYDRILKVSRTIADIDGAQAIQARHMAEAAQYRQLDLRGGE